jgi:predicted transcriptional regulator
MENKMMELAVNLIKDRRDYPNMSPREILEEVRKTYLGIMKLNKMDEGEIEKFDIDRLFAPQIEEVEEKISPENSIQKDKVICLECGKEFKQLTFIHLREHGLTPKEYKAKWGFGKRQPLSCLEVSKRRSKLAKERGLPENLRKYQASRRKSEDKVAVGGAEPVVDAVTSVGKQAVAVDLTKETKKDTKDEKKKD